MAKYILVYELGGYPDEGGGIHTEEFGTDDKKMHEAVEAHVKTHRDNFKVIYAGFLQVEYKYETVEYAVKVKPKIVY